MAPVKLTERPGPASGFLPERRSSNTRGECSTHRYPASVRNHRFATGIRLASPWPMRLGIGFALFVTMFVGSTARRSNAMGLEGAESDFLAPARQNDDPPLSSAVHSGKPWDRFQTTLGFNLGIGSAIGIIGATVSFSPTPMLLWEAGIGQGLSGTQLSIMQKLALGAEDSTVRFVAGAGISWGSGSETFPDPSLWLNLDLVGMEIRTARGLVFFLAGGATVGLAGGKFSYDLHEDCGNPPACSFRNEVAGVASPQGRMGFAVWF